MGLELLLMEAQTRLQPASPGEDVSATIALVRLGSFEVRLLQPLSVPPTNPARFWLELFDHDRQLSIDSVGDRVIEDAVIAADEFIVRALQLGENPHAWRRSD
jgi:hypothetical protein